MNWQRSLFRVWISASLCWLVFVGALAYHNLLQLPEQAQTTFGQCEAIEKAKGQDGNVFNCFDNSVAPEDVAPEQPAPYWSYVLLSLAGPLGSLAAWHGAMWIGAGFRKHS